MNNHELGSIYFIPETQALAPGTEIKGRINLTLHSNLDANLITLTLHGEQSTKVYEHYTTKSGKTTNHHYRPHYDSLTLIDQTFPVYSFGNATFISPGQYSFPVSFILPPNMPPSFNYEFTQYGSYQGFARVTYTLTAMIQSRSGRAMPVRHDLEICILAQDFQNMRGRNREVENTMKMTSLGCFDKGLISMKSRFEKEHYNFGETAYVLTTVDNSQSKTDITRLNACLKMSILVKAKKFSHKGEVMVTKISAIGVKKGEKLDGPKTQRLPILISGNGMTPSCQTPLISNMFTLEFELIPDCATLCCDKYPQIILPINVSNQPLKAPDTIWTQPDNWNPQQMDGYGQTAKLQMAKVPENFETTGRMVYPDMVGSEETDRYYSLGISNSN